MSDCKQIFAVLSQYLDQELQAEDCEAIRAHIAACAPCVEFVESLKKSVALCGRAVEPVTPVSAETREKLMAAFLASREKK